MKTYKVTVDSKSIMWYDFESGKLHREDGPACEYANGGKLWYREGKLHREDGPAIEYASGGKEWYRNGRLHREDGPAVEYASGDKYWYLNDVHLTEQQWKDQTQSKPTPSCDEETVVIGGQKYRLTKI